MSGNASPTKKSRKLKIVPLPKGIRDELRMTCALKGYSAIKCGGGKKLTQQYSNIEKNYHGKEPNHPSQIKLLSEASLSYSCLYDTVSHSATKKKDDKNTITRYKLKQSLTLDSDRTYYSGKDIRSLDLEKKNRSSGQLIGGRALIEMAKKGVKNYRQALSFCVKKWDAKTNTPIESGSTQDDVIEYVRCQMYEHLVKNKNLNEDVDSNSEGEENIDESDNENEKNSAVEKVNRNAEIFDSDDSDKDSDAVPKDYLFPSYFAFIMWGPFAEIEDRLSLFLTDETGKSKVDSSRAQKRIAEKKSKSVDAEHDSSANRGFTTSQRIEIESLNLQKEVSAGRHREATIVALSIEHSAVARQVEAAEKRATLRCPVYNKNNFYWKRTDELIEREQSVVTRIQEFNTETTSAASPNKRKSTDEQTNLSGDDSSGNEIFDENEGELTKKRNVS